MVLCSQDPVQGPARSTVGGLTGEKLQAGLEPSRFAVCGILRAGGVRDRPSGSGPAAFVSAFSTWSKELCELI